MSGERYVWTLLAVFSKSDHGAHGHVASCFCTQAHSLPSASHLAGSCSPLKTPCIFPSGLDLPRCCQIFPSLRLLLSGLLLLFLARNVTFIDDTLVSPAGWLVSSGVRRKEVLVSKDSRKRSL